MSARTIAESPLSGMMSRPCQCLALPETAVRIRKSGIEFHSSQPFAQWAEMTVRLETPRQGGRIDFTGVVVACIGNRHTGYEVVLAFTNLSPQNQARLNSLTA